MNLKLTYLLLSIAILATSCNSDPSDDPRSAKGAELSFNVSDLSRASVTNSIDQFLVYGDTKSASSGSSSPLVLFDKTPVVYKNNNWTYEGAQFWIPKFEHSFVAVSPAKVFTTGNNTRYSNSRLSFEYSIPAPGGILSNNDDVADILAATHRRYYENDGYVVSFDNKVTFRFGHLMSLINLSPAFYDNKLNSYDYILIHKLQFSGIKTKAQFNILPAQRLSNDRTDDMTVDVTPQEEGTITLELSSPKKIENNARNVNLFTENDAVIMLPQVFGADSEAKIIVFYSINDEETMNQGSILLKNTQWESGKSYLYKFTIERIGLKLNGNEINPWNNIQGEKITVD